MKRFLLWISAMAIVSVASAQTIINMPSGQNPLFEVSTNNVDAALHSDVATLGADLLITGGSGTYSYLWKDGSGKELGKDATLYVEESGIYTLDIRDTCDCQQTVTFNLTLLAVEDLYTENPEAFRLEGKTLYFSRAAEISQMSIFTAGGVMSQVVTDPGHSVDLSMLTSGAYIVCLTRIGGETTSHKIMLQ